MSPRQLPGLVVGIAVGLLAAFFFFGKPSVDPAKAPAGGGSGPKIPVPEPTGLPIPAGGEPSDPRPPDSPDPAPSGGSVPGGGPAPGGGGPTGGTGTQATRPADVKLPPPLAGHLRDVDDGVEVEAQYQKDTLEIAKSAQMTYKLEETKQNLNAIFKKTAKGVLAKFSSLNEAELADEVHASIVQMLAKEGHKVDEPADEPWRAYLEKLGNRIASHAIRTDITYRFHVVHAPVWNAFATPGGNVYFYTGILESMANEAQLVGVLGHEIGHVDLGHCSGALMAGSAAANLMGKITGKVPKNLDALLSKLLRVGNTPFSSANEAESDDYGVKRCLALGYSPHTMASLWRAMAADREGNRANPMEVAYRSHPAAVIRYMNIMGVVKSLKSQLGTDFPARLYLGRENYRQKVTFEERGY